MDRKIIASVLLVLLIGPISAIVFETEVRGAGFWIRTRRLYNGDPDWISKLPERSARARVRDILRTILGKIPREIGTPGITGFKT